MKERYRKQKFLKNFGLQPNKNPRYIIDYFAVYGLILKVVSFNEYLLLLIGF